MGSRGVAGQRATAVTSACAHARRTLLRLFIAGAFCLVGWAGLAVVDAGSAAASEHTAGGVGLDDAVSHTVRDVGRATGDEARQPARDQAEPAERGSELDAIKNLDGYVAEVVDRAGVRPPADEQPVSDPVRDTAGKVTVAGDELRDRLAEASEQFPEPEAPTLPGTGLLPGVGEPSDPPASTPPTVDDPGEDAGDESTPTREPRRQPVDVVTALGVTTTQPATAAGVNPHDRPVLRGDPGMPDRAPVDPRDTGFPAAGAGSAQSAGGGAASGAPLVCKTDSVEALPAHLLLGTACTSDDRVLVNDAKRPPISPD